MRKIIQILILLLLSFTSCMTESNNVNFEDYIKTLDKIPLPLTHNPLGQFPELSKKYNKEGFKKYSHIWTSQPLGILYIDKQTITIVDCSTGDWGFVLFLMTYDLEGNKIDSASFYKKSGEDIAYYAIEYLTFYENRTIIVKDTVTTWSLNENKTDIIEGTMKVTVGETIYKVLKNGKIEDKVKSEIKKFHELEFPKDYVISMFGTAGDECVYYFYTDNKILIRDLYFNDDYKIGEWRVINDTINISLKYHFGYRGIGEPIIPEGWETVEVSHSWEYENSVKFYEYIDYKEEFSLSNIGTDTNFCKVDTAEFASDFRVDLDKFMLDGDFTIASMKILDTTDLESYSSKELRFLRNEIFARYGYVFKSKDLSEYFGSKRWYYPSKDNVDEYLTSIEKKNIDLIQRMEK